MYQNTCVLEAGASLDQATAAYLDQHPLDHDDDIAAEHGVASFRYTEDNSPINYFSTK